MDSLSIAAISIIATSFFVLFVFLIVKVRDFSIDLEAANKANEELIHTNRELQSEILRMSDNFTYIQDSLNELKNR